MSARLDEKPYRVVKRGTRRQPLPLPDERRPRVLGYTLFVLACVSVIGWGVYEGCTGPRHAPQFESGR